MRPPPEGLSEQGRAAWAQLCAAPIAHRGLWSADLADDRPENSLAAFRAASEAGYGVELDVRLAADGVPVVFHDAELERLTGAEGALEARSSAELAELRLAGGSQGIPTLAQALEAAGDALVLVEIKADSGARDALPDAVAPLALAHEGPLAVIGFGRQWHARFGELHPQILRGNNFSTNDLESGLSGEAMSHFILPSLEVLDRPEVAAVRAAGTPVVSWTARSPEAYAFARERSDAVIFEGFCP